MALLSQRNVEEAAPVTGITADTLLRWMKDPHFDTAYREAKRAAFSQAIARLHQMSSAAVSTLGKIMIDPNSPASARVRAADSILNHYDKSDRAAGHRSPHFGAGANRWREVENDLSANGAQDEEP
ncbi:MAG: hypothetical protein ABI995_01310 [Acidobacteriota bacterium]